MLVAAWDAAPLPNASHTHKPLALLAPSRRNSSKLATVICVRLADRDMGLLFLHIVTLEWG